MPSEKEIEAAASVLFYLDNDPKEYLFECQYIEVKEPYLKRAKVALQAAEAVRLATPPASVDVQEVGVV